MAALVEQGDIVALNPKEGFVVKSKIIDASNFDKYELSTKVFINICHDTQVPKPPQEFDPSVVFPLIINNQWEIPIITSREKESKDKKGQPSLVYDCCINSICFRWSQLNADLKSILIEWCIEAVEMMYEIVLEREYSIPKMLSKGELTKTEILKSELEGTVEKKLQHIADERLGLIEDLREKEEQGATDNIDGELPDIMNVSGKKKRLLIEEVDVVKKVPAKKSEPKISTTENSLKAREDNTETEDSLGLKALKTTKLKKALKDQETALERKPSNKDPRVVEVGEWQLDYDITVKETTNAKCIQIKLPKLSDSQNVKVDYSFTLRKLIVTHTDSKESSLEIDISGTDPESLRSMWVKEENSLYIISTPPL